MRLSMQANCIFGKKVDLESVLTKCPVTGIPLNSVWNKNKQCALNFMSPRLVTV